MKYLTIALAVGAVVMNAAQSSAADKRSLHIVIDGIDDDATACNVSSNTLTAPATLVLRQNGITVTSAPTFPYLYVNVNVMRNGPNYCTFNLMIQVKTLVPNSKTNGFANAKDFHGEVMCQKASLNNYSKGVAASQVFSRVEEMTKICLSQLEY